MKNKAMIVKKYSDEQSWLDARLGKITGTRLKDLVTRAGTGKKIGFYEILAERIAIPATEEKAMDRGKRLEDIAIERFVADTKKKVDNELVIWYRDDNEDIAISPDGSIGKTEAIECKCLSSAKHIEAYLTKKIPAEYEYQKLQYFIVNDKLKKLYFMFYDPRLPKIDLFWIEVKREDVKEDIEEYLALERETLKELDLLEEQLTF
jgi:predicted phage-related endonuclease